MYTRPDILWVSLESVRADHTSLYGYHRDTTPNLAALSDRPNAHALETGIAASMWTPASTASMLTGTHMSTHQVGRDGKGQEKLPPSIATLPELLSDAGYDTSLFSPNPYISSDIGLDRGFEHAELTPMSVSNFFSLDSVGRDSWLCAFRRLFEWPPTGPGRFKTDVGSSVNCLIERRVKRWFDHEYSGENPFFTYAHVQSPHHTYQPPTRFFRAYADDIEVDSDEARNLSQRIYTDSEGIKRLIATGLDLSDREWEAITALYDAEIRYADHTANEMIRAAQSASNRPLVVVVTGDHGELFGECGLVGHNLVLHDAVIKVPMLVAGIDGIEDGDRMLSQHVDLTYTLASLCDVLTDQFEGRDLRSPNRPYAISQRGVAHLEAYTKHDERFDTSRFFERPFTSVRTADWKYLESDSRSALYDLPDERTDQTDAHPEVAQRLSAITTSEGIDWSRDRRSSTVSFDQQAKDRLDDLGYLS